jgi:hypothetical protein
MAAATSAFIPGLKGPGFSAKADKKKKSPIDLGGPQM